MGGLVRREVSGLVRREVMGGLVREICWLRERDSVEKGEKEIV